MNHLFRLLLLITAVCCPLGAEQTAFAQKWQSALLRWHTSHAYDKFSSASFLRRGPVWPKSVSFLPVAAVGAKPVAPVSSIARLVAMRRAEQTFNVLPDKGKVDAIIFDLDGTLLDSLGAWDNSGVNFLRSRGIEPPEGLQEQLVQMSLMDGARWIKEKYHFSESPEELLRQTLQPIRNRYYTDIQPKPGVPYILRLLRAQGVKLCIATASDRELAEAALKRTGLLDFFDFIITCDEVGSGKSTPAVYEAALKKLGTDRARTLVAEDALYALRTARKAGFLTAAVADEHSIADRPALLTEADYYIHSFVSSRLQK